MNRPNSKNNHSQYADISLSLLKSFSSKLPFDVFIKRTDTSYTKVFSQGDLIDWARVTKYHDKGVQVFFCKEEDYLTYMLFVEKMGEKLAQNPKGWHQDEAALYMKEMANFTIKEIQSKHHVSHSAVESASSFTHGCIETLKESPKNLIRLVSMLSSKPYLMKHATMTAMFALILAKQSGLEGERTYKIIGMGALFHDIGEGQLSFNPENEDLLTGDQRQELMRHPELGKRMVDGMQGISEEVGHVIMQHHEQPNGQGYPNRLRGHQIYLPAKYVAIADSFSSLITKRSFREAFNVPAALSRMEGDQGKFDEKLLEQLKKIFIS